MNSISGKTKLLGILGAGIDYTLSPKIHGFSARKLALDFTYVPLNIDAQAVAESVFHSHLKSLIALGFAGLNITQPFKSIAAKLCQSPFASVNTLSLTADKSSWQGHSTDGEGLLRAAERIGFSLANLDVLVVLGSGGAATALLECVQMRAPKAKMFVHARRGQLPLTAEALSSSLAQTSEHSLLVQATSAPAKGDALTHLVPALDGFRGVFVDMVYAQPSALLAKARELGLRAQDGLPMLIEQARLSQEIWWGKSASFEDIADMLTKG